MGLGVVGLDFQGLPVMRDRLVDPSAARQSGAEVVVGLGVVGPDFQGLPVMRHRLVDPSAAAKAMPRLLWASSILRSAGQSVRSRASRCRANTRLPPRRAVRTARQPRPRQRPHSPAAGRPTPTGVGRRPDQGDRQPDLRQVGEPVGLVSRSDLHQPDHRHHHPQIPEPADQQIGTLSSPNNSRRGDGGQKQRRPTTCQSGKSAHRGDKGPQDRPDRRTCPDRRRRTPGALPIRHAKGIAPG